MTHRVRKVLVEFVRSTSHLRPAFRFEVPILKVMNPGEQVVIHPIPNPTAADVHEISSAREAYLSLQSVYGQHLARAYVDFTDFEEAFKASAIRDSVGNLPTAPAGVDQSPDNLKLESTTMLAKIGGVGPEIASAMFESGLRSIEDVARSTLDELEAIPGIGPQNSARIKDDAKRIVLASVGDAPDAGPQIDTGAPLPPSTNPFE